MARILLLGTWLTSVDEAKLGLEQRGAGKLTFGGLAGQLEVTGPRIEVERGWIVNDRTWQNGMPRSVVDGKVESLTDDLFVVIDEPSEENGRSGRRR